MIKRLFITSVLSGEKVQLFRNLVSAATNDLNAKCKTWDDVRQEDEDNLPYEGICSH